MAIEIKNMVHAMAVFTAANPPVMVKSFGVTGVTRLGAGIYDLTLRDPMQVADGTSLVTVSGGGTNVGAAAVLNGSGGCRVTAYNAAGAAADGAGVVTAMVIAYPGE